MWGTFVSILMNVFMSFIGALVLGLIVVVLSEFMRLILLLTYRMRRKPAPEWVKNMGFLD